MWHGGRLHGVVRQLGLPPDHSGAFCLEHAKSEPRPELTYTPQGQQPGEMSARRSQRSNGWATCSGRYGATGDATTAAALAILVHAGEGDTLTTGDLQTYTTSLPDAVRTRGARALAGNRTPCTGPTRQPS